MVVFDGESEYRLKMDVFLNLWQRVIVAIDQNKERKITFTTNKKGLILCFGIFSIPFILMEPILSITYYFLSLIGILLSVFIIQKELGYSNNLVKKFCGSQELTGCDKVIASTIKLPFEISLSDLSLVYFMLQIFNSISDNFTIIKTLGVATIPIILFSLIYQAVVIRKWCALCLSILGVLIVQLVINFIFLDAQININTQFISALIVYALSFVIFVVVSKTFKNELAKTGGIKELKIENLRFRRDYNFFMANYNMQKTIDTALPRHKPEITIGNPNAAVELIIVSNPMCGPCAQAHLIYSNLQENYPEDVFLRIRFYVPLDDKNDPRTINANKLLMLNELLSDDQKMKLVLHQWYKEKKFSKALNDLLIDKPIHESMPTLKIHKTWCLTNQINITPTLLINGKIFPTHYQLADIENFMEALITQETNTLRKHIRVATIYDN